MDIWGIVIFVASLILYFVSRRNRFFIFTAGFGMGIVIGAVWATVIVMRTFSKFGF